MRRTCATVGAVSLLLGLCLGSLVPRWEAHSAILTKCDVLAINGQTLDGYNATLKLKQLDIANPAGAAIQTISTGGNGAGIAATGHGGTSGMTINGSALTAH